MAKGRKASTERPTVAAGALLRPASLGDAVYEQLLQNMISGEISPDQRVSVDDLVRKLGVSQTPIREALARLEAQGLVVKTHLVGYRAAPQPTQEQFDQLFDTRFLIEPYAAAKAAINISSNALDRLEELSNRLRGFADSEDVGRTAHLARGDTEFHKIIAAESGNAVIGGIMETLQVRIQFLLLRRRGKPASGHLPLSEHEAILDALRAHDPNRAAESMRNHLKSSRARYWP
jgi:DNA-binding GntR family transcriptional regulator